MRRSYPIQVKQKDRLGRPDIDKTGNIIVALTVREILDEEIARKLV